MSTLLTQGVARTSAPDMAGGNRRKALKLATTFKFESISCPGIYLRDRVSDVYLQISVLGRRYCSGPLATAFPIVVGEQFHVDKVFTRATDPFQLGELLARERVIISLVQNFEQIAEVSVDLKQFIFDSSQRSPKSGETLLREVLITRMPSFPGLLSPRLEFLSQSSIREVIAKPKSVQSRIGRPNPVAQSQYVTNLLKGPRHVAKKQSRPVTAHASSPTHATLLSTASRSRPRSAKPKKTATVTVLDDYGGTFNEEVAVGNADYAKPGYMKSTLSSRSKSPVRAATVVSPRKGSSAPFTISSQKSKLASPIIKPDHVESLLQSPTARAIYRDAIENAKLNERLNSIKVPFDNSKGRGAWSNHRAFESGKSHREVFNSLLDDAYASLYDKLD